MPLKIAKRGQVPPFIAMDVLRAANERAAAGADVLHLEVGQPSTPAPAGVLAAARRAWRARPSAIPTRSACRRCARRSPRITGCAMASTLDPARVVVTTGSSGAFLLAFLAAFEPGDRVALAAPGYPAYRNILTALDLVPVELPAGPGERYQADARSAARARADARRADRRQPGQSDRHDAGARRAGGDRALLPRRGHPPGLRRDLSRHHLWHDRGDGALAAATRRSSSTASRNISR